MPKFYIKYLCILYNATKIWEKITNYQRYLLSLVEKATTIEEVQGIYVDFDNIPTLKQEDNDIIQAYMVVYQHGLLFQDNHK